MQRIYGPVRLPLLLAGWSVLGSFGFQKENFHVPLTDPKSYVTAMSQ
jgi:hypothetical protein